MEDSMTFQSFISLLGGIALFLYGMQIMGSGLQDASGGKLEKILERLTSNKWKGMLLGAGVTAVIQSSGATAVMVVGLVNSGIMDLNQAVGVILGANVGTTITAWILSLTGIKATNILVAMLQPAYFSPVLALIGVFLLMFSKKDKTKHIATIMIGFSILMIGMTTMSGAFAPLSDDPKFTGILTMFSDRPLMGLLAGLAVTAILQSSSASIGILQAISMSGTLTIASAIPVLMGENIGSAITVLIGAIGSNRNAKRAAWIQMFYCLLKTTSFMILFYAANAIVHFPFMNVITNPVMIAVIHSCFNIVAVLVFLPLSDILVRMVQKFIPASEEEKEEIRKIQILDEHFLASPSFALEQCRTAANEMAQYSKDALYVAMDLVSEYSEEGAKG
jgi:phosphate:Na+ symporter